MSNAAMTTANEAHEERLANLPDGWPMQVVTRAWVGRENDYWFALDADFDIVAQGDTREAAELQLCELIVDYLSSCAEDGIPFDKVRRPVPLGTRVRLNAEVLLTRVLGKRSPTPVRADRLRVPPVATTPC
jgi:hypothetical protein